MQVTERVARCFGNLRAAEFLPLMEYIKGEQKEALELLTKVIEPAQVYRLQGKAVVLGEIL